MSIMQRAQCALYQLGYNTQWLLANAEDYWFVPQDDLQFSACRSNVLGEIQVQSAVACELLDEVDQASVARARAVRLSAERAWEDLRESWHGPRHLDVISTLNLPQECDGVGDAEWWSRATPLDQPSFRALTRSLNELGSQLPPNLVCCFRLGQLVTQVLTLRFNECEQNEIRGERFPIAALRQQLIECRQRVEALGDLEIDLPEAFAPYAGISHSEYCKLRVQEAHPQIIRSLSTASIVGQSLDIASDAAPETPTELLGDGGVQTVRIISSETVQPNQDDRQESEGGRANTGSQRLRQPSDNAIAAYRLRLLFEGNQTELAQELQIRMGRSVSQGQVSRWLSEVTRYVEAGNVLPGFAATTPARREEPMDPAKLDMGARQDPRAPRPSDLNNDD